jgi:hypothetical protein
MRLRTIKKRPLSASPLAQVFWALLLLPLLWLSVASNVPHDHDLHEVCLHSHQASVDLLSTSLLQPADLYSLESSPHDCLLCVWANALCWAFVAMAVIIGPALIRFYFIARMRRPSTNSSFSNSRAPPALLLT